MTLETRERVRSALGTLSAVVATLEPPHIVPVYTVGDVTGNAREGLPDFLQIGSSPNDSTKIPVTLPEFFFASVPISFS
jgi:hypothetical protein